MKRTMRRDGEKRIWKEKNGKKKKRDNKAILKS